MGSAGFCCQPHNCNIDRYGWHALSCQNYQGAVHARHDCIRDAIYAPSTTLDHTAEVLIKRSIDALPANPSHFAQNDVLREQHAS